MGSGLQFFTTFIAGFIVGFVYGWRLALVILAVSPLVQIFSTKQIDRHYLHSNLIVFLIIFQLAISGAFIMWLVGTLTSQGQTAYAKAGGIATEVLSAIKTVAAFGGEPRELKRYSEKLEDAKKIGIK